ncbi:MAG: hypothetical protein U0228_24265 [Myxococcaceae bacterium]
MLWLALVLAASPLTDAQKAYDDLEYELCVSKLSQARNTLKPAERAKADLLHGLCTFALGQEGPARSMIEAAFRRNPKLAVPSKLSPKELALVDECRARAAEQKEQKDPKRPAPHPAPAPAPVAVVEPTPAPTTTPEPIAPPPTDAPKVEPTPPAPQPIAVTEPLVTSPPPPAAAPKATWLPFVTGGLAVAAAGAGTGFGLASRSLVTQANAEPVQVTAGTLRTQAQTDATVANVAFAVAGTAAVATLVTWLVTR